MPGRPNYSAPALEKGLDILEYLAVQRVSRTQQEIATALDRSPNEIYRMLVCLIERGYISREDEAGGFRATLKLFLLGHQTDTVARLRAASIYPMEALADTIGQACHLSIRHGASILHLVERMPPRHICVAVGEGSLLPLVGSSSGKVLLSRMSSEAAKRYLNGDPVFTALSARRRSAFLHEIELIRAQGHLAAPSEITPHVQDIAVPVGAPDTDTSAVLAVAQILDPASAAFAANLKAVLAAAAQINRNLGISV
ncbi:MAG: IclR family transcriptional regulator [Opitutaceae bacterium]|jgi:DNA-binding IclR family transcriptional regulator|nr:IclR family transcriptional regulator [Opitutaceae bacterium]